MMYTDLTPTLRIDRWFQIDPQEAIQPQEHEKGKRRQFCFFNVKKLRFITYKMIQNCHRRLWMISLLGKTHFARHSKYDYCKVFFADTKINVLQTLQKGKKTCLSKQLDSLQRLSQHTPWKPSIILIFIFICNKSSSKIRTTKYKRREKLK